jgi:hypothetical protein
MTSPGTSAAPSESLFLASSARAILSAYRDSRITRVLAAAIIGPVEGGRALFIHILPLEGIEDSLSIGSKLDHLRPLVRPVGAFGWNERLNADGYLLHTGNNQDHRISAYVQWLRCGGVEIFAGNLVTEPGERAASRIPVLHSAPLAECLGSDVPRAVDGIWNHLGTGRILAISAVLKGMGNVHIAQPGSPFASTFPIDRDFVASPWIAIEPGVDPSAAIGETGDVLWQSAGLLAMPRVLPR